MQDFDIEGGGGLKKQNWFDVEGMCVMSIQEHASYGPSTIAGLDSSGLDWKRLSATQTPTCSIVPREEWNTNCTLVNGTATPASAVADTFHVNKNWCCRKSKSSKGIIVTSLCVSPILKLCNNFS